MPRRRPEDPDALAPVRVEAVPRRGLNRVEAARYVGISPPTFDKLVREGKMPQPFQIGSRTIYDLRKLDAAFDVLSGPEEGDSFVGWEDWDRAQPEPPKGRQAVKQADIDAHAVVIQARKDARRKRLPPRMSEEHPGYHNLYTPETLAEHWKCSANLIRNLIRRGELDGSKYGNKLIRITAAAVAAYEEANIVGAERG
jgi:predicted DNA-binding transcriptional regulator AlpA